MTSAQSRIHGIVLAGGRSSRMGTDKALLPVNGKPLLRHIIDTIAPYCDGVTVVVPYGEPGRYRDLLPDGIGVTTDRTPGQGPLAGIHTGLLALPPGCEYGFLMACDMPAFSAELFGRMTLALASGGNVPGAPEAVLCPGQPFHALYRRSAAAVAERLLVEQRRKLSAFTDALRAVYVDPPRDDCFLNLNTPDDYAVFMVKAPGNPKVEF
ncbi:molybdenum cofactor guanylyltransferase [Gordoniibacillus kamchatkensis]|uniref:molybdenum cofactor guanylyltransferase n=1 Tax=Gordoniibacillus kamchatkensis TaxID=1590651 RepID=UPI000695DDB7|nr:molybdenum cofactor guanylyltransferase [Paenibacillus sp. VKM B-2647]